MNYSGLARDKLNFGSLLSSTNRLNFGEEDTDNLLVFYRDIEFPLTRYTRVGVRGTPIKEQNPPRYVRVTLYKEDKVVAKALSPFIKDNDRPFEFVIDLKGRVVEHDKARVEVLVEPLINEEDIGLSHIEIYLGEEDV